MHPFCIACRPARRRGRGPRSYGFHGWLIKLVDRAEQNVLVFIPGVSFGKRREDSHAFVQVLRNGAETQFHRYGAHAFSLRNDRFDLSVGPNRFQLDGMKVELAGPQESVRGRIAFSNPTPLPRRLLGSSAMGMLTYLPFLQSRQDIVSMGHRIVGGLQIGNREIDLTGGRGYTETTWGREFPKTWIWMQSNHFEAPQTSFFFAAAIVTSLGLSLPGLVCVLYHEGRFFRMTTQTLARLTSLTIGDDAIRVEAVDARYRLTIRTDRSDTCLLWGPSGGRMDLRFRESLCSTMWVRLEKRNGELIFEGSGRCAGLECVGNPALRGVR